MTRTPEQRLKDAHERRWYAPIPFEQRVLGAKVNPEAVKLALEDVRKNPKIADFIVTFDGGKTMTQTLDDVFKWRNWSQREKQAIQDVLAGKVRRFSTSKDGVFCDIERRAA